MGGDGYGLTGGGGMVIRGDQNDVGEERRGKERGAPEEAEEVDFGLEVVDLTLELFLGLAGLLVAFSARAGVT